MRWEDTPELFGSGCGTATCGDFICDKCGVHHNKGNDESGDYSGPGVNITEFAGMDICEDCFEAIETEIFRRMKHILPWYRRIVEHQKASVNASDEALKAVGA